MALLRSSSAFCNLKKIDVSRLSINGYRGVGNKVLFIGRADASLRGFAEEIDASIIWLRSDLVLCSLFVLFCFLHSNCCGGHMPLLIDVRDLM